MSLDTPAGWLLAAAYLSLLVELVCFPIPSEASTWQLLEGKPADSEALAQAREQGLLAKLWRFALPTLASVLLFVLPLLVLCWPALRPYTLAPGAAELPAALPWIALLPVVLGRALGIWAVAQLRRGGAAILSDGAFGISRNPILVGMYLFYLGNCLWLPSPILGAGFVLYLANMHGRIRLEEQELSARHPKACAAHRQRVRRYLGRY